MRAKILLFIISFIAFLPCTIKAQDAEISSNSTISLVVKANNLFHFSKTPLNNYYALGGEAGVYFNDKIYIGISQHSSLAPSDIWHNNPLSPDKIRMYEYSLQTGYKFQLNSPLYLYTGFRAGYGGMHMEYRFNNGEDSDETMTREKLNGFFVTPDIRFGVKLHKYVSIEAGVNYRYYVGNEKKWGLSTNHMNGLGMMVSIVGNIPL